MTRRLALTALLLALALGGCIPASREPLVFEKAQGLPKAALGTYRTLNRAGEDAGRLEIYAQEGSWFFEMHSPAGAPPETLSGEFTPSKVPGHKDLYVFALLQVLKNGVLLEQTGSPFLLVRVGTDRLDFWTLVEPQATRGWFDTEVRYEDMHWLREHVQKNGATYVRENRPVLTATRSAKAAARR